MVDPAPSETFAFASQPNARYPFNYLVFTVEGVEGIGTPHTMEFVGEGIPDFTVVGADKRRMLF